MDNGADVTNTMTTLFGAQPTVAIHTNQGSFRVSIDFERVPGTAGNFLRYVADKFYDNTLIHRVVDNFIIQGGGFEPGMIQKTTRPPIENEAENGLRNERGMIAMARLPDEPDSATSQFFVNTRDNDVLNYGGTFQPGYCAFGWVLDGMEVVERIEGTVTHTVSAQQYVPMQEILVQEIVIEPRRK